jgi:hypothetical protein
MLVHRVKAAVFGPSLIFECRCLYFRAGWEFLFAMQSVFAAWWSPVGEALGTNLTIAYIAQRDLFDMDAVGRAKKSSSSRQGSDLSGE